MRTKIKTKQYNQKYYEKHREQILKQAKQEYWASKKPCSKCNVLISNKAHTCIPCSLKERNKSKIQRQKVSHYWKGRERSTFLKKWRRGQIAGQPQKISNDWLRLLGWILTDGSIQKTWGTLRIYQTKEWGIKKIEKILNSLKIKYSKYAKTKNNQQFYVHAEDSHNSLSILGLKANKEMPNWVSDLSKNRFLILLNSIIDGDGHRAKYGVSIAGTCKNLKVIENLLRLNQISCRLTKNCRGDYNLYLHQGWNTSSLGTK